jgi:hypothetical protein
MKNLSAYKAAYKAAKTSKGRTSAFNRAMLNLSNEDQRTFVKWQVGEMENQYGSYNKNHQIG